MCITDQKTGIHEPVVIIPWWLDCRDPKQDGLIPVRIRWPEWADQLEMKAAGYNRDRMNQILGRFDKEGVT